MLPAAVRSIVTAEQTYTHLLMKKKTGSTETDQKHMGNSVEEQNTDMPHQIVTQHMVAKIKSWHLMTTKMIISKILILRMGLWWSQRKVSSSTEDTGQHPFGITQQDKKTNLHTQFIIVINNMQDLMTIMNRNSTFRFVHILRCY